MISFAEAMTLTGSATNSNGLSRTIPSDVKRAVRSQCGFGCVLCGKGIIQYDHFDPPFAEANYHDPNGIALLCGGCHDRKTRGLISIEAVKNARNNPYSIRAGRASDFFEIMAPFVLLLGNTRIENVSTVVQTQEGENWFSIDSTNQQDSPALISVDFFDDEGNLSLRISKNEWITASDQWDVETEGRSIRVRKAARQIVLELESEPPHSLTIKQLRMKKRNISLTIDASGIVTINRNGQSLSMDGGSIWSPGAGFVV